MGQFLLSSIPELIGVFEDQPMTGGVVTAEKIHTIGYNLSNCQIFSDLITVLTDLICNYLYQIAHFIYELLHNLRQKHLTKPSYS